MRRRLSEWLFSTVPAFVQYKWGTWDTKNEWYLWPFALFLCLTAVAAVILSLYVWLS